MGTSCNYGGGPKWSSVKNAVTRTSAEGHLMPSKAAQVVNSFVSRLHSSAGLGSTGTTPSSDTNARVGRGGGGDGPGGKRGSGGGRRRIGGGSVGSGAA